ncbi:ABC transporter permease subunit [Solibacillus sp. CAU 1738]|uniref:ABC transporter permease subunit n=1 Tax=Solibacillus sp. CAU 1738 TaxID=3140363 RepID=UPI0032606E2C
MKFFIFELKKTVFSRRFSYTLLVLFIFILGLYLRNVAFQDLVVEEQERQVTLYTQEAQSHLRVLTKAPETEAITEQIKYLANALNMLYEWKPLIKSEDWQARLQAENAFISAIIPYKEVGGEFSLLTTDLNRTLVWNEHLLSQGIEPKSENYSITLPNFMKQITDLYVNFGAIILLLLIIGDMLTMEFENGSIRLLYTQPLKKSSIIHVKWASAAVFYIIITACLYVFTWLLGYIGGKSGTFLYPVMVETKENISFITIAQYVQWSLLSTTSIILFVISLCLLLSLIFKNSIITLLSTVLILIGGYFGMQALPLIKNSWFDPFQSVLAGISIQQVGSEWYYGIPIIILLAIILYWLSIVKINRTSGS